MSFNKELFEKAIKQFDFKAANERLTELNDKRDEFVKHFTPKYIAKMSIDEYASGKGKTDSNFCYTLEFGLRGLGSMGTVYANKYGVWYSKEDQVYKFDTKKYQDVESAFKLVRQNIFNLLSAGEEGNIETIKQIDIDPVVKGKILSIYYPDRYLNIFSRNNLNYFLAQLEIECGDVSVEEKRELLLIFKNEHPVMKNWSIQCFSELLYQAFPIGPDPDTKKRRNFVLEQYKKFILNCTKNAASVRNYTAFKKIDECLQDIYNNKEIVVLDIMSSEELENVIDQLSSHTKYQQINQAGNHQYSNALTHYLYYLRAKELFEQAEQETLPVTSEPSNADKYTKYIRALRTKPFMLLAGISGTGKSRIVRELAFRSCPNRDDLRKDSTTPGNYLMVEVKPNWHDSTEILGYYSNLTKKYHFTKFIKFLVKAKKYSDVPFFVCLDEMNLAPVEQYFAEFLSVLETRKKNGNRVMTGSLVDAQYMNELEGGTEGNLTLPDNVFIIGTVNMDDTTHQFSRKVIDRAMTIEMNGGELSKMFGNDCDLAYPASDDDLWTMDDFRCSYVNADEVIKENPFRENGIKKQLSDKLSLINGYLKNTPYQISYRVLNELCVYLGHLLEINPHVSDEDFDKMIDTAVDQITMMKILPRIEGDEDMFVVDKQNKNRLEMMMELFDKNSESYKKLEEMNKRLESGFTRFWP